MENNNNGSLINNEGTRTEDIVVNIEILVQES